MTGDISCGVNESVYFCAVSVRERLSACCGGDDDDRVDSDEKMALSHWVAAYGEARRPKSEAARTVCACVPASRPAALLRAPST